MKKFKYFFLILIIFCSPAKSEFFKCNSIKVNKKSPFVEARPLIKEMVDQILTIGDIKGNYSTCIVPQSLNASADTYKNNRIIYYDPAFLGNLANKGKERYWGRVFILAHEVAHLHYNHPYLIKRNKKLPEAQQLALQRGYEINADYFAGEILARMGASEYSTKKIISLLKVHQDEKYSDHPEVKKRLIAVINGWTKGNKKVKQECNGAVMPDIIGSLGSSVTTHKI